MSFSSSKSPPPQTIQNQENSSLNQENNNKTLINQIINYHNQTKHFFTHYSKSPHGLDWANQPDPFRRYISSPLIPLLHPARPESPLYSSLFHSLPSSKPISRSNLSQFLYDSFALSAWKTTGFSTWSLRVNPSSGNLHPTEAYIIAPPIESLSSSCFVAHYAPKLHSLELRSEIPSGFFKNFFPDGCFLVGLSSIFWREAWKYGERGFRYCNHDVGHAIGSISMAAAGLGWDVKVLDGLGFEDIERLMGVELEDEMVIPDRPVKGEFPEVEFEHPDCVLLVYPSGIGEFDVDYKGLSLAISGFVDLKWNGRPNRLSKEHVVWDIIYRAGEAVKKPLTDDDRLVNDPLVSAGVVSGSVYKDISLHELVRKRRSAVDMDGKTTMTRETFYQILLHCMPSGSESGDKQRNQLALPFRALPWDSEVHAALFVHRVVGLPSGLYFLVRNAEHFDDLKGDTRPEFKWEKPEGCPDGLPLYELARIDCRELSKRLSCHQDIASDGCFSLGMIAHFEPTLKNKGVWMYPRLFWETGILGQVLYLEAHAVGISATGIGCFFDDPVHEVLGLRGSKYQSLYHFTVGAPVIDKHFMSLPAYPGPDDL